MFSISNPSLIFEVASTITELAISLNPVEIVTPQNQREEKDLWLSAANNGVFRNPVFIYDKTRLREIAGLERKLAEARSQLFEKVVPKNPVGKVVLDLIDARIRDANTSIGIAHGILMEEDDKTAYNTGLKYGRPNSKQVRLAKLLATGHYGLGEYESRFTKDEMKKLKAMSFDAPAICEMFEYALQFYHIDGWAIKVDESATAIDVRNKTASGMRRVVVPVDRKVNGLKLVELIGHEIECHLVDSENAAMLFQALLSEDWPLYPLIPLLAKPDDEIMYEGHAKLSDVTINGKTSLPKPFFTIAQDLAVKATPFANVASHIYELNLKLGKSDQDAIKAAWNTTYRTFRGCTCTKNPHGYTFGKDYAYLAGFCIAEGIADPVQLQYASLGLSDYEQLRSAGVDLSTPKYPHCNAAMTIAQELLKNA